MMMMLFHVLALVGFLVVIFTAIVVVGLTLWVMGAPRWL